MSRKSFYDFAVLLVGLIPASLLKNRLLSLLGHQISSTASISPIVIWRVGHIDLDEEARLGFGTVLRDMKAVVVGKSSVIGQWMWVSSAPSLWHTSSSGLGGVLALGDQAAVTSRHYLDCSGGITIGDFATIAGVRSTILTHGIDVVSNSQRATPVFVGSHCLVGSNSLIIPGARVPNGTLFGMGSVITKGDREPHFLYAGNPARARRVLEETGYFARVSGFVSPQDV